MVLGVWIILGVTVVGLLNSVGLCFIFAFFMICFFGLRVIVFSVGCCFCLFNIGELCVYSSCCLCFDVVGSLWFVVFVGGLVFGDCVWL